MDEISKLTESISKVKDCSDNVESFLDGSQKIIDTLINTTKVIADFSKHCRKSTLPRPSHVGEDSVLLGDKEKELCELHVNGFDSEQIWQGIELSNEPLLQALSSKINKFCKSVTEVSFLADNSKQKKARADKKNKDERNEKQPSKLASNTIKDVKSKPENDLVRGDNDEVYDESGGDDYDNSDISNDEFDDQMDDVKGKATKNPVKKSVVDDEFFVLEEMNKFLEFEDKREMRTADGKDSDAEDVDYFADDLEISEEDSDDEELSKALESASKSVGRASQLNRNKVDARMMMYSDFFDEPEKTSVSKKSIKKKTETKKYVAKENNIEEDVEDHESLGNSGDEDEAGHDGEIIDDNVEVEDDEDDDDDEEDVDDEDGDNEDGDNEDGDDAIDSSSEEEGEDMDIEGFEGDMMQKENLSENVGKKSDDKAKIKSKFEKESLKMQETIKTIEAENVAQRSWQLIGEATAAKRPKNSLLEENLTFDQTLIAPPTVTEETTETLEQMITQRIKDEAWDDVVRKVKPVEKPFEYKKSLTLDQEKSKLSLAEVYEKEYIKQTEEVKEEETNPDHEKIENMMTTLFAKLDALSNFQFTPKQPKPELKIVSNLPSLEMEEQTPITVSTETMLAPEEIYDKSKKELKGKDERTTTDKKRERKEKKIKKREIRKNKEKKLKEKEMKNPGMVVKESKKAALEKLTKNKRMAKVAVVDSELGKSLKSSAAFFTHLQENVSKQIKKDREKNAKRKKDDVNKAENYKL